jgi:DNA-binding response OmpR family regulator
MLDPLLLLAGDERYTDSMGPEPWHQPWPGEFSHRAQILVAEDDTMVRRLIQRLLLEAGYEVETASHGTEALEIALRTTTPVDLAITDIRMPFMDGWELSERLMERWPGLPILFLSGFDREFERFGRGRRPSSAFLAKPFDPDELLKRVAGLLDRE